MIRHLVLSGGPSHSFPTTSDQLAALLAGEGVETEIVTEPAEAVAALARAEAGAAEPVDLLTVNALRWRMTQARYADRRAEHARTLTADELAVLDRFVRGGGALLALHTAVICFDADPVWHGLCGASWNWDRSSHPPLGEIRVEVTAAGRVHPITAGIEPFVVEDEAYGFLDEGDDLDALLVAEHGGRRHPLLWARSPGRGRVVTDLLGHGPASFEHPTHRALLVRAVAWATRRATDPAAPTAPARSQP